MDLGRGGAQTALVTPPGGQAAAASAVLREAGPWRPGAGDATLLRDRRCGRRASPEQRPRPRRGARSTWGPRGCRPALTASPPLRVPRPSERGPVLAAVRGRLDLHGPRGSAGRLPPVAEAPQADHRAEAFLGAR